MGRREVLLFSGCLFLSIGLNGAGADERDPFAVPPAPPLSEPDDGAMVPIERSVIVRPIQAGPVLQPPRTNQPAPNATAPSALGQSSTGRPNDDSGGALLEVLITKIALDVIDHDYQDLRDWNRRKTTTSGVDIRLDGLKLKTHRRRKEGKDGTWKMYQVKLADPQKDLRVDIEQLRLSGGKIQLQALVDVRLATLARLQQWERDVRLLSITVEAGARVRMRLWAEIGVRFGADGLAPVVILQPRVTRLDLNLAEFQLRRIGDVRGPLVEQLSHNLADLVADKLADREKGLVAKANKQIEKNRDALRLSVADFLGSRIGQLWKGVGADEDQATK